MGQPRGSLGGSRDRIVFLAVTGGLLIADLKHPLRFYLIFTRHHWRSWLVRGSFIIDGSSPTEEKRNRAMNAYRLLDEWSAVPGTAETGDIDSAVLSESNSRRTPKPAL